METVENLVSAYKAGKLKPSEVIAKSLDTIKENNDELNIFLDVYENAIEEAKMADKLYAEGSVDDKPLLGVPIAIKNNILIKGKRATAASKILENYTAVYDATIIERLREAGAIFVGSTNLDEFAMGTSTENSAYGVVKNPLDKERVPGGSSGGSAAAVALGAVPVAIGTDTGGSVRQPASFCGAVGFKPTYGAVSRYGIIALGSSLDQAGPVANSVADAEVIHGIMSGLDPKDATTIEEDTYPKLEEKKTYTFGVPRDFLSEGIDADLMEVFEKHLEDLKEQGHSVVDIDLPLFEAGLAAYYIVLPAEISSNLARYDGIRYGGKVDGDTLLDVYEKTRAEGFGPESKRRILLGTYVLSAGYYDAYYGKAELVRKKMREELDEAFKKIDFVVTPTTPTPAFKIGENSDPLALYSQDIFTVPVNLTGVPAITFTMGTVKRDDKPLPVGVQYIATHGDDSRLFAIGKQVYDTKL